jgi:hypothetical protein
MDRLPRNRVRLKIDVSTTKDILDVATSQPPVIWRGTDVQFELGIFWKEYLQKINNFSSITIDIKDPEDLEGPALSSKTLAGSYINSFLSDHEWDNYVSEHALVVFNSSETNIDLQNDREKSFILVVSAITTDIPSRCITLGKTTLRILEDGVPCSAFTPPVGPDYYTKQEADARYRLAANSGWLSGSGAPAGDLGQNSDFYLDVDTGDVFKKTNGVWGFLLNIKGEGSSVIHHGNGGPAAGLGNDGDYYLNVANGDFYTKANGAWSLITNLKGSPGDPGEDGESFGIGEVSIGFVRETPVMPGEYLLGNAIFSIPTNIELSICDLLDAAEGTAFELELELNGALTGQRVILQAGQLFAQNTNLIPVPANQRIRWKCVAGPNVIQNAPSGVSLSSRVKPQNP